MKAFFLREGRVGMKQQDLRQWFLQLISLSPTLRAEATFSLYELACEK